MALIVDSLSGKHGQLFLAPNHNERQHLIKLATRVTGNTVIRLTVYCDSQWKVTKAINDDTGLEIDGLDQVETQLGELITQYYLDSTRAILMREDNSHSVTNETKCPKCGSGNIRLSQSTFAYPSPLFSVRKHFQGRNPDKDLRSVQVIRVVSFIVVLLGVWILLQGGVPVRGSPRLVPFGAAPLYSFVFVAVITWLGFCFFMTWSDERKIRDVRRDDDYVCSRCSYGWTVSYPGKGPDAGQIIDH